jgi:hypothetical protein
MAEIEDYRLCYCTNLSKNCSQKWPGKSFSKVAKIEKVAPKIQNIASFVATSSLLNNTK